MTTPPVTTASFQSVLWPPDVAQIVNLLVGGAPFANSLTAYPTARSEVAFPTASPDRPAWTAEGGTLPTIGLHDDADIVGVAKLGEIVMLSNESVADTSVNLTAQVGALLRDAAGPELDRGVLYGSLAAEPKGVVPAAPAVDGTDLAAAITGAIGQIGNSGGAATHFAAKPSVLANARNTRATPGGQMLFPDGIGAAFGLTEVGVPELTDALVYDATRAYLIVRNDFMVEFSRDYAFAADSTAVRVRGRFAVGIPAISKTIRKVTVAGAAPTDHGHSPADHAHSPGGKRAT
jgi:HK97 family phage major capsid protein